MIETHYLNVLRKIHARLKDSGINWAITGSFGMALQGMELPVHDIDIQTDETGAYTIADRLSEYVVTPVRYVPSERMRSHLGKLEMDGLKVEVMGALQKRGDDGIWEEPVRVEEHRRWLELDGMQIPVLSLEYEYQAYLKLGRIEKANLIKDRLQNQSS